MAQREGESFVDKVKNALGMGDRDDRPSDVPDEEGWAGVPAALEEDAEVANRPAGPDYAADDLARERVYEPMDDPVVGTDFATESDLGVGLDRETLAGREAAEPPLDVDDEDR